MSTYSSLLNQQDFVGDSVMTGDCTATGSIDFSQGTLIGFPVDNTSIFISGGVLTSVGGHFVNEYVNNIYPNTGSSVSVAPLSNQTLITNNLQDNSLSINSPVFTDSNKNLISTGIVGISNGGTNTNSVPLNGQLLIGNGSNYNVNNITTSNGISITNGSGSINISCNATNLSSNDTIVKRDGSGNFTANIITANLNGNASSATNFSGSLSGDVSGTQSSTVVNTVGSSSASNIHNAELLANASTNLNTASTIVKRDGSGNFSCGIITGNLSGTSTNFSGSLSGDVSGTQSSTVVNTVGGSSASNIHNAELLANAGTSSNTAGTLILRDGSGNFSTNIIFPNSILSNSVSKYLTGTASQSGLTITGYGTTWTASMIGGLIVLNTGNACLITGFTSTTSLSVDQVQSVSAGAYEIFYGGFQVNAIGDCGVQELFVGKSISLPNGAITNVELANSSITVSPGSGLSGGGSVSLGGTTTLSLAAPVSISNGGTNLTSTPTNGQLLIGNGTNYTLGTLTGTTNEITVSNGSGTITLATPQAIATTSSPTFVSVYHTGTSYSNTLAPYSGTVISVSSGNSLQLANSVSSYVPANLNYYEEFYQQITPTGVYTTANYIGITRIGRMITISWPQMSFTVGASAGAVIFAIPSRFAPGTGNTNFPYMSSVAGSVGTAGGQITATSLYFYGNATYSNFPASTACIVFKGAYTYNYGI